MTAVTTQKQEDGQLRLQVDWEKANQDPAGRLKLAQDLYGLGTNSSQEVQYRLDALQQAVMLDPFQLSYRLALAELETETGMFELACQTYHDCQEYWPDDMQIPVLLGEVELESGKVDSARELEEGAITRT